MQLLNRIILVLIFFSLSLNPSSAQDQPTDPQGNTQGNELLFAQKQQIETNIEVLKLQKEKLENQIGTLSLQIAVQNNQTSQGLEQLKGKIQAMEDDSIQSDKIVNRLMKEKNDILKEMLSMYQEKGKLQKYIDGLKTRSLNVEKPPVVQMADAEKQAFKMQINALQAQLSDAQVLLAQKDKEMSLDNAKLNVLQDNISTQDVLYVQTTVNTVYKLARPRTHAGSSVTTY